MAIDVSRLDQVGLDATKSGIFRSVYLPEVVSDFSPTAAAFVTLLLPIGSERAQAADLNPLAAGKILSLHEQEVLTHVLARRSNREVAEVMSLSARAVEFHCANVMSKLDARNVAELVTNAERQGWKGAVT